MNRTCAVFLLLNISICFSIADDTYEHPEYIGLMLRKIDELQVKIANLENADTKLRASLAVANAKLANQDRIEQKIKELEQCNTYIKETFNGTYAKLSLNIDFLKTFSERYIEEFARKKGFFSDFRNKPRGKNK